jgi:hypothetical protein
MSPYGPPNPFPQPTNPGLQAIQQTMQKLAEVRMLQQEQQFYDAQAAARQKSLRQQQHHRAEVKAAHVILGLSMWALKNRKGILLVAESLKEASAYLNERSRTGEQQPDISQPGQSRPSPRPQSAEERDPRPGNVPPSNGSPARPATDPRLTAGDRRPRIIFSPDGTYGSAP